MRPFTRVAAVIFAVVAVAHLARLCMRWDITINGLQVPLWVSGIGLIVPALLAIMLWRESARRL